MNEKTNATENTTEIDALKEKITELEGLVEFTNQSLNGNPLPWRLPLGGGQSYRY